MGPRSRPSVLPTRIRPAHLALAGALLVGWTAGRAAREQGADGTGAAALDELPGEPVAAERQPVCSPGPRRRLRTPRRLVAGAAIALGGLLVSGTGISIGPGDARAPLLTPAGLAQQARQAARQARAAEARAESARVSTLRRLQTAGIAGRGAGGRADVVVRTSAPRKVQAAAPPVSTAGNPLQQFVAALGPGALLAGLEASRDTLQQEVLNDPRVQIYPAGRGDVASGKLDVRILALLEYLAAAHGSVTVSCLITGHSHFVHGRPGVVSAHVYGRAVDISAVGGTPILGHQEPGGITEQTVRELIALPAPLEPVQVISLLSLGGPSFALPDHANHIHVGF